MASVPPEVNVPPAPGPSPARSHIQRMTRASRMVPTGDISQTAADWLSAATSDSVHTAAGSGAETWWPIERGWQRWFESGTTSRRRRSSTSSIGRPACGRGSSKRRASSSGPCAVETRPSPDRVAAKYSTAIRANASATDASASCSRSAKTGWGGRSIHGAEALLTRSDPGAQPLPEPALRAGPDLGVDEVRVGHVEEPGDPPHEVLLVGVLLRVGERDQPEQLDEPLLLVGGELLVDEGRELVERPGAARGLLGQAHELLGLLAREAEDALHGRPHDRALLVLHRGVGADDLEEERRRREAQAVLPRLRRRLGDLRGDALLEEPLERAEHAPPRPYLPPWYLKETLTLAR